VKRVYFDTSAFVKIFIEEEASEEVERLVTLVRDKKIIMVISDWVINESIAVIDANNTKGLIDEVETQQILSEMTDMIEGKVRYENLELFPVPEKVLIGSRILMQDYHVAASDALHIFISGAAGCEFFISADVKLIRQLTTGKYKLFTAYNVRNKQDMDTLFAQLPS
jgi:predicted nucleic acid-binding protein